MVDHTTRHAFDHTARHETDFCADAVKHLTPLLAAQALHVVGHWLPLPWLDPSVRARHVGLGPRKRREGAPARNGAPVHPSSRAPNLHTRGAQPQRHCTEWVSRVSCATDTTLDVTRMRSAKPGTGAKAARLGDNDAAVEATPSAAPGKAGPAEDALDLLGTRKKAKKPPRVLKDTDLIRSEGIWSLYERTLNSGIKWEPGHEAR